MKNAVKLISLLTLAFVLAGCSSNYVMATKDGNMILTNGKPELDKSTGLLSYEDQQGNHRQINNNQVTEIMER